ncbi:MAG: ADP-ribosylglycohydrolase family protein, partial [Limisphaerales bacterium]
VAPLGAYFADDLARCAEAARASALVTHTHPEGVAGTIAVGVAAAMAWQLRDAPQTGFTQKFFAEILRLTPESKVRRAILLASQYYYVKYCLAFVWVFLEDSIPCNGTSDSGNKASNIFHNL